MGQKSLICVVEKTLGALCGKKTIEVLGEIDYVKGQESGVRSQNLKQEPEARSQNNKEEHTQNLSVLSIF
jgi:hypothetical protein